MARRLTDLKRTKIERPPRLKLTAKESLNRTKEFDMRKERFIAAVRKSKSSSLIEMIKNDLELQATRERIAFFYGILLQMRVTTEPEEYMFMANSYISEIEKMHAEVLEYLKRHPSQIVPAEAA